MTPLNLSDVTQYVEQNIGDFHKQRLTKVADIKLKEVLLTKNPYLFKAKHVTTANELIEGILSAYISSSEEGIFGNWLERLAIFINDSVYHGRKAAVAGMDLDFDRDDKRYLVNIKSGPNWANGGQVKHMIDEFNTARKRLATSGNVTNVVCVNGCCYGRSNPKSEYKSNGSYYKVCGQRFWELISGNDNLFTELILPLGHEAEERNREYNQAYGELVNRLSREFLNEYSNAQGGIDWEKLVRFNSSMPIKTPKTRPVKKRQQGYPF
jgi:hypothetical protein